MKKERVGTREKGEEIEQRGKREKEEEGERKKERMVTEKSERNHTIFLQKFFKLIVA